jgi:FAD synthase
VHVVGYHGTLYDRTLDVLFLARLRAQTTFADEAKLTEQIGLDVTNTQQIFAEFSKNAPKLLR